jgi:hypothetical protein
LVRSVSFDPTVQCLSCQLLLEDGMTPATVARRLSVLRGAYE